MKIREKQGKTTTEIREQLVVQDPDEEDNKYKHLEKERQLDLMSNSLDELNAEQKTCVTLFYLEKRSYQEIADRTGFTLMQVKSHIQNGKRNLKLLIEKKMKQNTA